MKTKIQIFLTALALFIGIHHASAQGTVFTYQGQLNSNGIPANGPYRMNFSLLDAPTNGNSLGFSIEASVTVSNGLFTVALDFGNVFDGTPRWLQIGVHQGSALGLFTMLTPLQQLTPTPYAVMANSASNLLGSVSTSQLPSSLITNNETGVSVSGTFSGDGSGLTNVPPSWQTVSGTNQIAASNESYLLTNNADTTLTLPASPNVGDIITVSGVGSGGWQVATGSGQEIVGDFAPPGVIWIEQTNIGALLCGASSSDGSHLVAGRNSGLYTSADFGTNWINSTNVAMSNGNWLSVASSSDGSHLIGIWQGHGIYTSINFGASWTQQTNGVIPQFPWQCVASSSDGSDLVATVSIGGLYTSTNFGAVWIEQTNAPSVNWDSIASSSDGSHLIGAAVFSGIYTSTDFGATWTNETNGAPVTNLWQCVASSSDGSCLVATTFGQGLYTSTNFGIIWVQQTNAPPGDLISVASSSDGSHLTVASRSVGIYTSTNFGFNWLASDAPPNNWSAVASSSNGSRLVALSFSPGIYTSASVYPPFTGMAGDTTQFQYIGNGLWQPLDTPASQIAGTLSLAQLPSALLINSESNVTLNGTFSGNGLGLTGLNAANLIGYVPSITLNSVPAASLTGFVPSATLDSVPAASLTGFVPSATLDSVPAASLTGFVPSATLDSVPAASLTGFVPSATLNSVPAVALAGTVADGSLSANVALRTNGNTFTGLQTFNSAINIDTPVNLEGDVMVNTNIYLDAHAIYFRGDQNEVDHNHGLAYAGDNYTNFGGTNYQYVDGPALWGNSGGVLGTSGGGDHGALVWSTSSVTVNGTFNNNSDRNAKQDFTPVTPAQILDKVAQLPLSQWSYKTDASTRHIGPMAQDFYSAFNVGTDDRHIAPIDEGGVALAAIKGLNQKVEAHQRDLEEELKNEIRDKDRQIQDLEQRLKQIETRIEKMQN